MKAFRFAWTDIGETLSDDDCLELHADTPYKALMACLEKYDDLSCFVDGYPQSSEFEVMDLKTKEIYAFRVSTDFDPQFYVERKPSINE